MFLYINMLVFISLIMIDAGNIEGYRVLQRGGSNFFESLIDTLKKSSDLKRVPTL